MFSLRLKYIVTTTITERVYINFMAKILFLLIIVIQTLKKNLIICNVSKINKKLFKTYYTQIR